MIYSPLITLGIGDYDLGNDAPYILISRTLGVIISGHTSDLKQKSEVQAITLGTENDMSFLEYVTSSHMRAPGVSTNLQPSLAIENVSAVPAFPLIKGRLKMVWRLSGACAAAQEVPLVACLPVSVLRPVPYTTNWLWVFIHMIGRIRKNLVVHLVIISVL